MSEERKMDLREYKNVCQGKNGDKSVNESLLKNIERATGGRSLTKSEFDHVHGKIKMKQASEGQ